MKWFNGSKGFGFNTPENGGLDLFVHQSEVEDYAFHGIPYNQPVEFEIGEGDKGPRAMTVRLV